MTATTLTTRTTHAATAATGTRPALWRPGLLAALVAAAATTSVAAAGYAVGVSFATPDGSSIPLLGFAQLTAVFATIGVVLAAALRRWACRPRRTFVTTTVVLTALSLVPDATFGFDAVSAVVLMGAHLLAAAIVVPVVARRLRSHR